MIIHAVVTNKTLKWFKLLGLAHGMIKHGEELSETQVMKIATSVIEAAAATANYCSCAVNGGYDEQR